MKPMLLRALAAATMTTVLGGCVRDRKSVV